MFFSGNKRHRQLMMSAPPTFGATLGQVFDHIFGQSFGAREKTISAVYSAVRPRGQKSTPLNPLTPQLTPEAGRSWLQSGRHTKNMPGLTMVPHFLKFSLCFLGFPSPFEALASYKLDLMAVAWLYGSDICVLHVCLLFLTMCLALYGFLVVFYHCLTVFLLRVAMFLLHLAAGPGSRVYHDYSLPSRSTKFLRGIRTASRCWWTRSLAGKRFPKIQ